MLASIYCKIQNYDDDTSETVPKNCSRSEMQETDTF